MNALQYILATVEPNADRIFSTIVSALEAALEAVHFSCEQVSKYETVYRYERSDSYTDVSIGHKNKSIAVERYEWDPDADEFQAVVSVYSNGVGRLTSHNVRELANLCHDLAGFSPPDSVENRIAVMLGAHSGNAGHHAHATVEPGLPSFEVWSKALASAAQHAGFDVDVSRDRVFAYYGEDVHAHVDLEKLSRGTRLATYLDCPVVDAENVFESTTTETIYHSTDLKNLAAARLPAYLEALKSTADSLDPDWREGHRGFHDLIAKAKAVFK